MGPFYSYCLISFFIDFQLKNVTLGETIERKDAALQGCESEIDSLNKKVNSLSKDIDHRKSISRVSASSIVVGSDEFEVMNKTHM